eukprot:scaffold4934_cov414-Ochromonas_danica.AAC.1
MEISGWVAADTTHSTALPSTNQVLISTHPLEHDLMIDQFSDLRDFGFTIIQKYKFLPSLGDVNHKQNKRN